MWLVKPVASAVAMNKTRARPVLLDHLARTEPMENPVSMAKRVPPVRSVRPLAIRARYLTKAATDARPDPRATLDPLDPAANPVPKVNLATKDPTARPALPRLVRPEIPDPLVPMEPLAPGETTEPISKPEARALLVDLVLGATTARPAPTAILVPLVNPVPKVLPARPDLLVKTPTALERDPPDHLALPDLPDPTPSTARAHVVRPSRRKWSNEHANIVPRQDPDQCLEYFHDSFHISPSLVVLKCMLAMCLLLPLEK